MFNFLDLAIIILLCVCVLIGAHRGVVGSIARLLGGVLKLVVSVFLVKPFVKVLKLTNIDEQMFDKLAMKFAGLSDKFSVNLVGLDESELSVFVDDALADAQIPKLFRGLFANVFSVTPETIALRESVTLAELMSITVTNMILLASSFVVLFVLLWVITKLIVRWSKRSTKGGMAFARTNRWLGALFGFVEALAICFVFFVGFAFLSDFGFMQKVVLYTNESFLGRIMLKITQALIDNSFDLRALLEDWMINK